MTREIRPLLFTVDYQPSDGIRHGSMPVAIAQKDSTGEF